MIKILITIRLDKHASHLSVLCIYNLHNNYNTLQKKIQLESIKKIRFFNKKILT